jgi:hypothetical protein
MQKNIQIAISHIATYVFLSLLLRTDIRLVTLFVTIEILPVTLLHNRKKTGGIRNMFIFFANNTAFPQQLILKRRSLLVDASLRKPSLSATAVYAAHEEHRTNSGRRQKKSTAIC